MTRNTGASADAETGSREPSPSSTGLVPAGFDPARVIAVLTEALERIVYETNDPVAEAIAMVALGEVEQ